MIKTKTYPDKLSEIFSASQFEAPGAQNDNLTMRTERQINRSLQQLMKQGKISGKTYQRLKTTGSQLAKFFGFDKANEEGTQHRSTLSIFSSRYKNFNKFLSLILLTGNRKWKLSSNDARTTKKSTLSEDLQY